MLSIIWFYATRVLRSLAPEVAADGCAPQDDLPNILRDASLVMRHYMNKDIDLERFKVCEYMEGLVFIGPERAVFWVKDGKVYVANEAAGEVAPDLPAAPPDVRAEDILQALDKGYYLL